MFEINKFKGHKFIKGKQTDFVKKKIERFKLGLSIECKKHGEHLKWRAHSDNNVQCLYCAAEWQMNMRRREPLKFLLRDAKKHAKEKNREFKLTLDELKEILEDQQNKCIFTGLIFNDENPISLDRIDSSKGYIKENIQLITIRSNKMKSDMTDIEFIDYCKLIVAYSEARRVKKKKKKKDNK
jgi:hypothetical protein